VDADERTMVGEDRVCDWGQNQGAGQARQVGVDGRQGVNQKPRWLRAGGAWGKVMAVLSLV